MRATWTRVLPAFAGVAMVLATVGLTRARGAAALAVSGTVAVVDKQGAARPSHGVVVYLDVKEEGDLPQVAGEIRQHNLAFEPPLTVITRGSQVTFPNQDKVFHNVFSLSRVAPFDLGLYKSGTSRTVTFSEAGVVDVYCNIHPQMVAKVKVLDSPYFAVSGPDGSFRIDGVPAGRYPVVAWHPSGGEARGTVEVKAGAAASLSLTVTELAVRRRHVNKEGRPYTKY
jgi:plastocyanin